MANNTRQATMADLETRTAALETGLKNLTERVDHNHTEMKHSMDEMRKEVRETFDRLAAMMNSPAPTKTADRGKEPRIEESSVGRENSRTGPDLPHLVVGARPAYDDETLDAIPRPVYWRADGNRRRLCTRTWDAARDARPRPARAPDTLHRKLELPIFQGDDVLGWLNRAERYFLVNGLPDYEKLEAASICFEGKALHWYQWRETHERFRSWKELKAELSKRFQGQPGRVHEELFALTQDSTVEVYRENFERLSAGLRGLPPDALVGTFMKGLKASIREGARVHRPSTLVDAMHLAQLVEEEK